MIFTEKILIIVINQLKNESKNFFIDTIINRWVIQILYADYFEQNQTHCAQRHPKKGLPF